MSVYYWLQTHRTKFYAVVSIVALAIFIFTNSSMLRSVALGALLGSMVYFIMLLFKMISKWVRAKNNS